MNPIIIILIIIVLAIAILNICMISPKKLTSRENYKRITRKKTKLPGKIHAEKLTKRSSKGKKDTITNELLHEMMNEALKKSTYSRMLQKGSDLPEAKEEESKPIVIEAQHVCLDFYKEVNEYTSIKELVIKTIKKQRNKGVYRALDDISFKVRKGEVLGVIGTNGAGKSTLLKIIAGALSPTSGKMIVDKNKVQILTLGTGFDMEMTGRENVYLNGSIIGYDKQFLDNHYDQIVEFAQLQDFMDERVKNYSSGMVSRLGFAIATAGNAAEILILDEVLSVGDRLFQKKSLKRVKEMIHGGSTVIMVSHSTATIKKNCDRALWLEKGHLIAVGAAEDICNQYEKYDGNPETILEENKKRKDIMICKKS